MKNLLFSLAFLTVIKCIHAEITVSEFIVSTNAALHVRDNKIDATIIGSRNNLTVQDPLKNATSSADLVPNLQPELAVTSKNDSNYTSTTEEPVETTTTPTPEEVILVFPEVQPEIIEPEVEKPDIPVDNGLSYFLVTDFPGVENRPIIYKPHYIQTRPLWSAIFTRPSYSLFRPPFFRDDAEEKQRSNLFPNQPEVGDDVNLSRKELMKMRLNQLRVSKMIPDLHPRTPADTTYVLDAKPEPSPTIQWEVPRKLFQWPFWPFTYFFGSTEETNNSTKVQETPPIQISEPVGNEPSIQNQGQGQRNFGNQFQVNHFMEFGQNFNPAVQLRTDLESK